MPMQIRRALFAGPGWARLLLPFLLVAPVLAETPVDKAPSGDATPLFRERLLSFWSFEIASADGRSITLGKVVLALLLILLGYLVARTLSAWLGRSVFPRIGLAPGAAAAFQTLAFYALVVLFVVWALQLVAIPLTIFTVLGGVLAIGIGFGSQNIVNNFISGLIILAERPIKVGDLIELDGVSGKIERVGPRSSHIRSGDNTHTIVPNSAFLEKNILNWTMADDVVRSFVDVGVAYGSPVARVEEVLLEATAATEGILGKPEPEVLFTDFGDSSLVFRTLFWVRVAHTLDVQRAQSRLRYQVDEHFRAAGIEIAFPQQDLHLDSRTALEVRLVKPGESGR